MIGCQSPQEKQLTNLPLEKDLKHMIGKQITSAHAIIDSITVDKTLFGSETKPYPHSVIIYGRTQDSCAYEICFIGKSNNDNVVDMIVDFINKKYLLPSTEVVSSNETIIHVSAEGMEKYKPAKATYTLQEFLTLPIPTPSQRLKQSD